MSNFRNFPIVKTIWRLLNDDAVLYGVVAVVAALWLDTHNYDQLIMGAVLGFAGLVIGADKWSDVQNRLSPFRDQIEDIAEGFIHKTLRFNLPNGKEVELDYPDDLEPAAVAQIVAFLTGSVPDNSDG